MFRKLKVEEIQARVNQVTEKGCSLLLYKDARVDRTILDETVGVMNWQNDFKVIDGKMYGFISIWDKEKQQWITKGDCGVESNTEKEKGEASDCFKRAGFKWGIGIELYSAPFIWCNVPTEKNANGKWQPVCKSFELRKIGYADNGDINFLEITDNKGNVVYKTGTFIEKVNPDEDLINGFAGIADMTNLRLYYETNYSKAVNKQAFADAKEKRKKELKQ